MIRVLMICNGFTGRRVSPSSACPVMMIEGEFVCANNNEGKKIRENSVIILTNAAQNLNGKSYIVLKNSDDHFEANQKKSAIRFNRERSYEGKHCALM